LLTACRDAYQNRRNVPVSLPQFSPQASASAYISLYSQLLQKPPLVEANVHRQQGRPRTPADGAAVAS
jgi:hypothetical protein